jgi:hypothetical protein
MHKTRRPPVALGISLAVLAVLASALGAGYLAASTQTGSDTTLQAGDSREDPQATATVEATPTPNENATAEETASTTPEEEQADAQGSQEQGLLVYAEYGESSDRIVSFDPLSGETQELAGVAHFANYGINGSVSVDGAVAYLRLPPEINSENEQLASFAEAELWVIDDGGNSSLASGFDPRQPPIWSPDGSKVVVRTLVYEGDGPARTASLTLVAIDGSETTLVERNNVHTLAAAGFSQDGELLYFAETRANGETVIQQVDIGSGAVSEIARGRDYIELVSWTVGDGELAAIILQDVGGAELERAVVTIPLDGSGRGRRTEVPAVDARASTFAPSWRDGSISFAMEPAAAAAIRASGVQLLEEGSVEQVTSPSGGFDIPRFWSRGLNWLAGLRFGAFPPTAPGVPFVLLDDGTRINVPARSEVTLFGWR